MARQIFQGARVCAPASHDGSEELDSQVKCACRRRERRNYRSGREAVARGEFKDGNEIHRCAHRGRNGKIRRNKDGGQRSARSAAIRLHYLARPGSGRAATVRGLMRPFEADSIRRKQPAHQYDGHRRALENASQHSHRLPRKCIPAVIWVTSPFQTLLGPPGNLSHRSPLVKPS